MENSGLNGSTTDPVDSQESKTPRGKNILKSKTFKDGGIYLFVRGDYVKPTWMCRIKAPGMTGYVYRSTGTTDEHTAYKFADDLYHQQLVKVHTGGVSRFDVLHGSGWTSRGPISSRSNTADFPSN